MCGWSAGTPLNERVQPKVFPSGSCLAGLPSGSENLAGPGLRFQIAARRSCSRALRASSSGDGCACGMSGSCTSSLPYVDSVTTMRAAAVRLPFERVTETEPGSWRTSIG